MGAASARRAPYDYPRLQRAVEALLEAHEQLRTENAELRAAAEAGSKKLGDLDAALRDERRRREAAIARIDALVARLDELGDRLERADAPAETAEPISRSAAT